MHYAGICLSCQPEVCFTFELSALPICYYVEDVNEQKMDCNPPQWVALAVVQSYNPRRKVPRSKISIPDLERCLLKASFSAAQNSGKHYN